jgi:acyl dehydratase
MTCRLVPFSEIPSIVGTIVVGPPYSLTREDVDRFAVATWLDRVPPVGDPEHYPEGLVAGFHSLSLLDALSLMTLAFDTASCWALNYGFDRVRFVEPLTVGEVVTPTFTFREVRKKEPGYLVLRHCVLEIAGKDRPHLTADWWDYVLPRDGPSPLR